MSADLLKICYIYKCGGDGKMPVLSMFYGILIKMNWKDNDKHHLPHFHAYYNEFEASFDLQGEIIAGDFPSKQAALVKAWTLLHQDELTANWKLAIEGEQVFKINPLQ